VDAEQADIGPASGLGRLGRLLILAAVVLFLGLLAYGLAKKSRDDTIDARLAEGKTAAAPGFSLELLSPGTPPDRTITKAAQDGKIGIDELRGTPIVLNFWASWCRPCEAEAPVLEAGWKRSRNDGVLFLGLDIQDLHGDAREFSNRYGITYPSVREPGKKTLKRYGATAVPETFFISSNGRVVAHVVGAVSSRQLANGVAAARAGRTLGNETGGARRPPR
jgi:cytochrome c biogenesis protein CcmG/thiol:disulfide interchange protein DsbE